MTRIVLHTTIMSVMKSGPSMRQSHWSRSGFFGFPASEIQHIKGLFTCTVSVSVSVTIKVYHCVNGNSPLDGQNGFCTHSACQTDRTIGTMLNFDGDGDGHGDGDGTCKQALMNLKLRWLQQLFTESKSDTDNNWNFICEKVRVAFVKCQRCIWFCIVACKNVLSLTTQAEDVEILVRS